jgi:DNA-binding transcriptional MerR regulator
MEDEPLKTLKEVADHFARPAHRIIHLCETGLVRPTVDAAGRGSVRRFSRDDTFRIFLALYLQEAGVDIPRIKPLMEALDRLMELPEVKRRGETLARFDLVEVILAIGAEQQPVLAVLTPPSRVALVTPKLSVEPRPDLGVELHMTDSHLFYGGVSIVLNLTLFARYPADTLWKKS